MSSIWGLWWTWIPVDVQSKDTHWEYNHPSWREKMCFTYQQKMKKSWLSQNEKSVSIAKLGLHSQNFLLCVWNLKGFVYYELVGQGRTFVANAFDQVNEALHQLGCALVNRKDVIFQYDYVTAHFAKQMQGKKKDC